MTQRTSELAEDGSMRRRFMRHSAALPCRAWAGTRLQFSRPLRLGETAWRATTQTVKTVPSNKGGPDHVLTVMHHEVRTNEGLVLTEDEDWIHCSPCTGAPKPVQMLAPADHFWEQIIYPNEVLLFRYSALTFNSHRIHYDRRFATELKGHRGLVVQPTLVATLQLELLRKNLPGAQIRTLEFREVQPLFDTAPFAVCARLENDGTTVRLWAKNAQGGLAVSGTAAISYA